MCDAGTVNTLKVVHALIANPSLLSQSIPLESYENKSHNRAQYEAFFTDTVLFLSQKGIEVCGIICDNTSARIKGLNASLLANRPGSFISRV
jgi:hypothetical protein